MDYGRFFLLGILCLSPALGQHVLHVTPSTMEWGYFRPMPSRSDRKGRRDSYDRHHLRDSRDAGAIGGGGGRSIREMKEMYAKVKDRGPGPHFLTGPVAVEGAMPGDVLEVEIVDVRLRSPYGWMMIQPGSGGLPEEFPYLREKLVRLDEKNKTAEFGNGIRIPIRPFSATSVWPLRWGARTAVRRVISPGTMDNRWLVAGTRIYIPVQVPGALFSVGDGHAAQGDGEVCLTAIETNLTGVFRFTYFEEQETALAPCGNPDRIHHHGLQRRFE